MILKLQCRNDHGVTTQWFDTTKLSCLSVAHNNVLFVIDGQGYAYCKDGSEDCPNAARLAEKQFNKLVELLKEEMVETRGVVNI